MGRRGKDRYGTPSGRPRPQAIDPWSGFKIDNADLVKQWDGQWVARWNCDIRNPQDFVRGRKEHMNLEIARPETPDVFAAGPILWEDDSVMTTETGAAIYTQGIDAGDTL